jgi:hypothetical protein
VQLLPEVLELLLEGFIFNPTFVVGVPLVFFRLLTSEYRSRSLQSMTYSQSSDWGIHQGRNIAIFLEYVAAEGFLLLLIG